MGLGFLDNLFSSKKKEETSSTQTGTATTENNLWDEIQPFFQQYQDQFTDFNGAKTPVNAYQTGAADAQTGVAGTLTGAGNAAAGITENGLTPDAIQRYMNPYIQNVVDPTLAAQKIQNDQAISGMRGNQAVRGALGNNTGSEAAYYAGVQPGQQKEISSLYSQGFDQAGQLATQDINAKLQGVQAQGQVAGQKTGANTAGYQMGSDIRAGDQKSNLTPYDIANSGVQGLGGLGGLAGQTTNTSGTATGTGLTTSTPSTAGIIAGLAGTALSASDERVKENIVEVGETHDGQKIYKYNFKGDSKPQIGLLAQEVESLHPDAVADVNGLKMVNYDTATKGAERRADGGGVSPTPGDANGNGIPDVLESKVGKYFDMLHGLRKRAAGGAVEPAGGDIQPMALGGDVGLGSWGATVTPEPTGPSSLQKFGSGLSDLSKGLEDKSGGSGSALADQQRSLASMLSGISGHASGGEVPEPHALGDLFSTAQQSADVANGPTTEVLPALETMPSKIDRSEVGTLYPDPEPAFAPPVAAPAPATTAASGPSWMPSMPFSSGVWAGDKLSPMQRFGAALTQVGDSPFAGVGKSILAFDDQRLKQLEANREKTKLGMEQSLFPMKSKLLAAQAQATAQRADINYQLKLATEQARIKRESDMASKEALFGLIAKAKALGATPQQAAAAAGMLYYSPQTGVEGEAPADDTPDATEGELP